MDCVLLIIPQQPPTPTLTCDEPNVLLGCLHLPDHVVLQVAEVAVQPVGHPVVVVLVHGLRHQVLGELLEAGPGQVPRRFGRLKYSARVQGVHVGVLLGELELVPVRGHPLGFESGLGPWLGAGPLLCSAGGGSLLFA